MPAAALDHTWGHLTATAAAATGASFRGAAKVNIPQQIPLSLSSVPCYARIQSPKISAVTTEAEKSKNKYQVKGN